ncbi:hypothetical protein CEUSTIGMA_g3145.t1 [Chlamydomonas eustigma]|uniref:Uncharacterized protein n=1 Tax=Chlamydomonas eustigma TaxID=1157962 RepID=A0A250WYL7_9CHLO|nr:hypothetical protein CEUSTIGMA_g3145.t1 [Chlamydomonas eustigma]|eukprot:GAX75702.1 hypothetical protein CEUSTIGMA_g3145.t1 [Chlamydomonas eustigma]
MRVAQLAACVAEATCFHHGEAYMQGTLVCMAQDYIIGFCDHPFAKLCGSFMRCSEGTRWGLQVSLHFETRSSAFNPEDMKIFKTRLKKGHSKLRTRKHDLSKFIAKEDEGGPNAWYICLPRELKNANRCSKTQSM